MISSEDSLASRRKLSPLGSAVEQGESLTLPYAETQRFQEEEFMDIQYIYLILFVYFHVIWKAKIHWFAPQVPPAVRKDP